MYKLIHNDKLTAEALRLYALAKNFELSCENHNPHDKEHSYYTDNALIGERSLPIMIINEAQCITTTRGIVDYIEATRRTPRLLTPDLSPSPLQVNAVHIVISAIQANLYINPLRPTTLEDRRAWAEVFTGFFDPIHEGQMFLDEEGFSVLDCFFYPATSVYLPLADLDSHKIAVLDYRERVESRTIYAGDPTRNPDNWSDIDGPVIY